MSPVSPVLELYGRNSDMVNTHLGMRTYLSYLRLICSGNLAWLKSGNHGYIKQAPIYYLPQEVFTLIKWKESIYNSYEMVTSNQGFGKSSISFISL